MLWDLVVCGSGKERHREMMRKYIQKEFIVTDKILGSSCSDQSS